MNGQEERREEMSSNDEPAAEKNTADEAGQINPDDNRDALLQYFVDVVNNNPDLAVSVTLNVSGIIVAGRIASRKEYFELLGDQVSRHLNVPEELAKQVGAYIKSFGVDESEEGESTEKTDKDLTHTHYIHLSDARMFHNSGGPIPYEAGLLWRCRINSVDAFSIGRLEIETSALSI
jgi:hypothetical protein